MRENTFYIPYPEEPRAGCKDIWNSYLLKNAIFDEYDIPYCPTTATKIPSTLISIQKAKALYEEEIRKGNKNFKCNAFIHPYIDDQAFDGPREGFWHKPEYLFKMASHFDGMITIDFSTNLDFPDPIKRMSTYKMRTLGFGAGERGIPVINNVRWGEEETWGYSFSGLPKKSIYAIGTVASGIKKQGYKEIFVNGLLYMVDILEPKTLIIIGSDNLPVFNDLRKKGINIVTFKSDTANYFERRSKNE